MQYRYTLPVKKEVFHRLDVLVRLIIFGAVLLYLYGQLKNQEFSWSALGTMFFPASPFVWVALALVPVNLGLEAWRWKYILSVKHKVRFIPALEGVLGGLAFALVTPHAVGDYLGRLMSTPLHKRERYVGSILISRVALLMWTILFGGIGVYFLFGILPAIGCVLTGPVLLIVTFLLASRWQFPGRRFLESFLEGLRELGFRQLTVISVLGLLRYLVFTLQFMLLLWTAVPLSPILILGGVTWIFLAKSVLPSVNFLGDLGIREFSAVYFFSFFAAETWPVVAASLLLWCMNIALPALSGSLVLLKHRAR